MAEYYPLLSGAVAALEPNTPETRRAFYDRARTAQLAELRKRPFIKKDFDRERLMLEDAISRVERTFSTLASADAPSRSKGAPAALSELIQHGNRIRNSSRAVVQHGLNPIGPPVVMLRLAYFTSFAIAVLLAVWMRSLGYGWLAALGAAVVVWFGSPFIISQLCAAFILVRAMARVQAMASERQSELPVKHWQTAVSTAAGLAVFVAVSFGVIRATGAPPGGVLGGAFFASLLAHAAHGVLDTWLLVIGWIGCLGFIFAFVGAFRHRRSWATLLLWIGVVIGAQVANIAFGALSEWLGSASPGVWDGADTWSPPYWDAGAYWGASAAALTFLLVTAADFVRGLWRWSNGGSFSKATVWFWLPLYSGGILAFGALIGGCILLSTWLATLFHGVVVSLTAGR
jgi:hypothetical protein